MTRIIRLLDGIEGLITRAAGDWLLPSLARFAFAAVLLVYYWNSGLTKLGEGFFGFLSPSFNGYAQIFPKTMEAISYDASQLNMFHWAVAVAGTWAEFLLPLAIVVGLLTRLSALGMIGFVLVQSIVDVQGHGAKIGGWFNGGTPNELLDERLLWITLLMVLVVRGGGPFSVDRLLGRR